MTEIPLNTAASDPAPKKQENPWLSLAFNIAIPSYILMKQSGDGRLGPELGFAVALMFPFIRRAPGYDHLDAPPLSSVFLNFDSYFEAAVQLTGVGLLPVTKLAELARHFINRYGMLPRQLTAQLVALRDGHEDAQLRDQLESAMQKLHLPLTAPGEPLTHRDKIRSMEEVLSLSEQDILAHAATWVERMLAHKEQRDKTKRKKTTK